MKDYRQLFGIAAIIMAVGFLVRSFQPAHAINGPMVSMGSNPIEGFSGAVTQNATIDLFTVPSNEVFIVTTCVTDLSQLDLYSDSTLILEGHSKACSYAGSKTSFGFLKIESGKTLKIKNTYAGTGNYFIGGYYAQP